MFRFRFLVSLGLGAILVILLAGCQSKESKLADALARGGESLKKKDLSESINHFRKAIQIDAASAKAHAGLGRSLEERGELIEAQAAYARAAELAPADRELQRAYGDATLTMFLASRGESQALRDQLDKQAAKMLATDAKSADALRYKAYIAIGDKRPAEAVAFLQRAAEAAPQDAQVSMALTQALFQAGRAPEAEAAAEAGIARNKGIFPLYDTVILHYTRVQLDLAKAEKYARLKVDNNPGDATALLGLARFHAQARKPEEEEKTLSLLTADPARNPDGWLQLAAYRIERGDYARAEPALRSGLAAQPKDPAPYQRQLAIVLARLGRQDEALQLADRLTKDKPSDAGNAEVQANLNLESGDPARIAQALNGYQKLAQERPKDPFVRMQLGRAHLAAQDPRSARIAFEEARKLAPGAVIILGFLGNLYLQERNFDQAAGVAGDLLIVNPGDARARIIKARALSGLRRFSEARAELRAIPAGAPGSADAAVELAWLDLAEGHPERAEPALRKLYAGPGKQPMRVTEGLARARAARGDIDGGLQLLEDETAIPRSKTEATGLLGDLAFATRRFDASLAAYNQLLAANPNSGPLRGRIAEVYEAKGDLPGALAAVEAGRKLDAKNAGLAGYHGFLLEKAKRPKEAATAYRECLALDAGRLDIANNLSFLLADAGIDKVEAVKVGEDLVRKAPNNVQFRDTLGWAYYKAGDLQNSSRIFEGLVRLNPDVPSFRRHYAMVLRDSRDVDRARSELRKALETKPNAEEAQQIREVLQTLPD